MDDVGGNICQGPWLKDASEVFDAKVLTLLDPTTRALFGRVGMACRDAVLRCPQLACAGRTAGLKLLVENFVGSVAMLAWARASGCQWDEHTARACAAGGHLEVLQWARARGCPWNVWTCNSAAEFGYLEMLAWAVEQGCDWDNVVCRRAARGGHLEVLQWAREHGCEWDEECCINAAEGGNLQVLRWARDNGCSWDECVCAVAAQYGHLEVLQWARAEDRDPPCPWSKWTCRAGTWRCCSGRGRRTALGI